MRSWGSSDTSPLGFIELAIYTLRWHYVAVNVKSRNPFLHCFLPDVVSKAASDGSLDCRSISHLVITIQQCPIQMLQQLCELGTRIQDPLPFAGNPSFDPIKIDLIAESLQILFN